MLQVQGRLQSAEGLDAICSVLDWEKDSYGNLYVKEVFCEEISAKHHSEEGVCMAEEPEVDG
jgi:hypothetical protein